MPETTEFTLKKSKRAKHIRLTINSTGHLIIVVPHTFNLEYLPTILEKKKSWIEKSLSNFKSHSDNRERENITIPDTIELKAIDTVITVRILPTGQHFPTETQNRLFALDITSPNDTFFYSPSLEVSNKITIKELPNDILEIRAHCYQNAEILAKINAWLTLKARQILTPWLLGLAEEHGISVKSVSIRSQQTRWGSCSTTGRISLNRALLFLPPMLVTHIMLHELCHIKEMNHSTRFWDLLAQEDQNAQLAKAQLKKGWQLVPYWAIPNPHTR